MQHRFHVDKGFSPSGAVHSSKSVERAQEMPPVANLLCPFLEKARKAKTGHFSLRDTDKRGSFKKWQKQPEKRASPDLAGAALLRSAEMTNYSTPRHMKIKN